MTTLARSSMIIMVITGVLIMCSNIFFLSKLSLDLWILMLPFYSFIHSVKYCVTCIMKYDLKYMFRGNNYMIGPGSATIK